MSKILFIVMVTLTFDPKINRVLPLPQGNHVAKFIKDPIYRTKVFVRKPVWMPAARHTQSHNTAPSRDGRIKMRYFGPLSYSFPLPPLFQTPSYGPAHVWRMSHPFHLNHNLLQLQMLLIIQFSPFGLVAPKHFLCYLTLQCFDLEWT